MFFCKSETHTIRNRILLYKDVDDKTNPVSINVFEMFWIYVILLKVSNLVTLDQGVRTIQS